MQGENQYELASTFLRLQEFYESPKFAGKYFGLETYMDWYAAEYGNFTYTKDWNGFNVPGNVVRKFFSAKGFLGRLLRKEEDFMLLLADYLAADNKEKFYIIGVHGEGTTTRDVMKHEYAHAFYYLNKEYKKEQDVLVEQLPTAFKEAIFAWLKEQGYMQGVYVDECQAYLSTNTMLETAEEFSEDAPWETILKFQQVFDKYFTKYKEEK